MREPGVDDGYTVTHSGGVPRGRLGPKNHEPQHQAMASATAFSTLTSPAGTVTSEPAPGARPRS